MTGSSIHPKARLVTKRNVRAGLISRTRIIESLEHGSRTVKRICQESGMRYERVLYHLNSLLGERIVTRSTSSRPYIWALTPYGQQKLRG